VSGSQWEHEVNSDKNGTRRPWYKEVRDNLIAEERRNQVVIL